MTKALGAVTLKGIDTSLELHEVERSVGVRTGLATASDRPRPLALRDGLGVPAIV
jgi:hypothetical protein